MMRFLHAHHASEDDGLYPLVLERAGTAADVRDVFDRIRSGHDAVSPMIAQLESAAAALVADGSEHAAQRTVVALDALGDVLLPHLREDFACWGRSDKAPRRVQLENRVSVTVEADIDEVWGVVREVTRVGEWSHECVGAEWLVGADAPVPGARFRGRNRAGVIRWRRVCEIVSAEPYELLWVTVPTALYPDSSEWRITLTKADEGTTISQQFKVLRAQKVLAVLFALVIPAHRDRTTALVEDLTRLGAVATRSHPPT